MTIFPGAALVCSCFRQPAGRLFSRRAESEAALMDDVCRRAPIAAARGAQPARRVPYVGADVARGRRLFLRHRLRRGARRVASPAGKSLPGRRSSACASRPAASAAPRSRSRRRLIDGPALDACGPDPRAADRRDLPDPLTSLNPLYRSADQIVNIRTPAAVRGARPRKRAIRSPAGGRISASAHASNHYPQPVLRRHAQPRGDRACVCAEPLRSSSDEPDHGARRPRSRRNHHAAQAAVPRARTA